MTQRPLRIGEARALDHRGQVARTRHGNVSPSVFTEVIVIETQLKKLKGLCDDPVTDDHSVDLAEKAAREIRRCLTRAQRAIRTTRVAMARAKEVA